MLSPRMIRIFPLRINISGWRVTSRYKRLRPRKDSWLIAAYYLTIKSGQLIRQQAKQEYKMVKQTKGNFLDGRDEFFIGLIAGFIPLVGLAAMIY